MLRFRTFHNTDPPAVAAIWRSRSGQPGLIQPVSVDLLEQLVFGKVYFDYEGMILAWDDGRPVGFAHAAFGPSCERDHVSTETGVTCVVMVRPDCNESEVAAGLLDRCEDYLRRHGAKVLYGGAACPVNPFYLGLYGGCRLPGVLDADKVVQDLYRARGYHETDRTLIYRRTLGDFRPLVDRQQIQWRRTTAVRVEMDPPSRDWWEACTEGNFDVIRFELIPRSGGEPIAAADFRLIDSMTGGRSVGLLEAEVDPAQRRRGAATHLLGEGFRHLARQGITTVEAQTTEGNTPGVRLLEKLGMKLAARGAVFRKELGD